MRHLELTTERGKGPKTLNPLKAPNREPDGHLHPAVKTEAPKHQNIQTAILSPKQKAGSGAGRSKEHWPTKLGYRPPAGCRVWGLENMEPE